MNCKSVFRYSVILLAANLFSANAIDWYRWRGPDLNGIYTPIYRYFQRRQEETFNVTSFSEEDIVQWLAQAGLEVRHLGGPGTFLLITATKACPERGDVR